MMRTGSWVFLSAALLAAGVGASACSSSGSTDKGATGGSGAEAGACDGSSCAGALGDGGAAESDGGATASEAGNSATDVEASAPACVPTGAVDLPDDAFEDSNCDGIDGDKAAAIFVSPSGADTADGSFDAPVKTITEGVALASEARQGRVRLYC